MLILELQTLQSAQSSLATINALVLAWWQSQGYTVVDGQLIGKRNGVDAPESAKTITWDVIKQSPEGTFYFTSLSNDTRFSDWTDIYSSLNGIGYIEKKCPDAWMTNDIE